MTKYDPHCNRFVPFRRFGLKGHEITSGSWNRSTLLLGTGKGAVLLYHLPPDEPTYAHSATPPLETAEPTKCFAHGRASTPPPYAGRWAPLARVACVRQAPLRPTLFCTLENNRFHLWDVNRNAPVLTEKASNAPLFAAAWSTGSDTEIMIGGMNCSLRLLDVRSRCSVVWRANGAHANSVRDIAWHPRIPHCIVTGGEDAAVKVWDARAASSSSRGTAAVASLQAHEHAVVGVSWCPRFPDLLASVDLGGQTTLWGLTQRCRPHHVAAQWEASQPALDESCTRGGRDASSEGEGEGEGEGSEASNSDSDSDALSADPDDNDDSPEPGACGSPWCKVGPRQQSQALPPSTGIGVGLAWLANGPPTGVLTAMSDGAVIARTLPARLLTALAPQTSVRRLVAERGGTLRAHAEALSETLARARATPPPLPPQVLDGATPKRMQPPTPLRTPGKAPHRGSAATPLRRLTAASPASPRPRGRPPPLLQDPAAHAQRGEEDEDWSGGELTDWEEAEQAMRAGRHQKLQARGPRHHRGHRERRGPGESTRGACELGLYDSSDEDRADGSSGDLGLPPGYLERLQRVVSKAEKAARLQSSERAAALVCEHVARLQAVQDVTDAAAFGASTAVAEHLLRLATPMQAADVARLLAQARPRRRIFDALALRVPPTLARAAPSLPPDLARRLSLLGHVGALLCLDAPDAYHRAAGLEATLFRELAAGAFRFAADPIHSAPGRPAPPLGEGKRGRPHPLTASSSQGVSAAEPAGFLSATLFLGVLDLFRRSDDAHRCCCWARQLATILDARREFSEFYPIARFVFYPTIFRAARHVDGPTRQRLEDAEAGLLASREAVLEQLDMLCFCTRSPPPLPREVALRGKGRLDHGRLLPALLVRQALQAVLDADTLSQCAVACLRVLARIRGSVWHAAVTRFFHARVCPPFLRVVDAALRRMAPFITRLPPNPLYSDAEPSPPPSAREERPHAHSPFRRPAPLERPDTGPEAYFELPTSPTGDDEGPRPFGRTGLPGAGDPPRHSRRARGSVKSEARTGFGVSVGDRSSHIEMAMAREAERERRRRERRYHVDAGVRLDLEELLGAEDEEEDECIKEPQGPLGLTRGRRATATESPALAAPGRRNSEESPHAFGSSRGCAPPAWLVPQTPPGDTPPDTPSGADEGLSRAALFGSNRIYRQRGASVWQRDGLLPKLPEDAPPQLFLAPGAPPGEEEPATADPFAPSPLSAHSGEETHDPVAPVPVPVPVPVDESPTPLDVEGLRATCGLLTELGDILGANLPLAPTPLAKTDRICARLAAAIALAVQSEHGLRAQREAAIGALSLCCEHLEDLAPACASPHLRFAADTLRAAVVSRETTQFR